MKDWLINLVVGMILNAITDDKIESLAHTVQGFLIPFLREQKAELVRRLKEKAQATDTEIDDAIYHAIDVFLESFIPKDAQCLIPAKKSA